MSEKRRYFRINDVVGLSYRPLNESHAATGAACVEISAAHLLREIDREFNQLVNALWTENPTLAKAIGLINRKIEILTDEVTSDDGGTPLEQNQVDTPVNISGCGIGFYSADCETVGEKLELLLTLKPSNTHLNLQGSVVGCTERDGAEGKPYWLQVEFSEHNIAAQEQLIQHIMQRQFAQQR